MRSIEKKKEKENNHNLRSPLLRRILAISLPRAQRRKTVIRCSVDIIKSTKAAVKHTEVTVSEAN